LPDKYPDQDIIFIAKALSLESSLQAGRDLGRWRLAAHVNYAYSWAYSEDQRFTRRWLGLGASIGR
jgi:hypothetical protein